MPNWERRTQIIILVLVASVVFGIGYKYAKISAVPVIEVSSPQDEEEKKENDIVVHVAGAVGQPGVYVFKSGARVNDAVLKADPLPEANLDAINLAAVLEDGIRIQVPIQGPAPGTEGGSQEAALKGSNPGASGNTGGKINLNLASMEELDTLPGIGPAYAERIIAYREENGGFSNPEELQDIAGIGPKTYERLKDMVCTY